MASPDRIIPQDALEKVKDRETLFCFLHDELKWPFTPGDTFTYHGPTLRGETADRVEVGHIVPFTSDEPFVLMLAEFQTPFRRRDMREILRGIRADQRFKGKFSDKTPEDIVFVCATDGYAGVRFAHFKEQEGRQPKLSVFGWDADSIHETRTLRHMNLPALTMPPLDMFGQPDWRVGRKQWMQAWDIEKVTTAFYKEYKRLFEKAEEHITGIEGDDKRLFTQKLFNRLLFIRFLERKRWLTFDGRHDYLCALWEDFQKKKAEGADFFSSRLKLLFFSGLNNEQEADLMVVNGGGLLRDLIGDVPYLNGGLFDEDEDKQQNAQYPDIRVPDEAIESLITGLFYDYNFTVTESTPDDVEVAVDPEMLGKVFEELVTGRHESGSYYTPKPVVSFMCREALKGYLRTAVPEESAEAIESFVDLHEPEGLKNPEAVLDALRAIKVCDPACGSGAYLLGMLHELMDLRASLFRIKNLDPLSSYEKKLEIIEGNVYGVDKDQFAVNTARLRLWLSLTVEYEGPKPEPLPNLDFKIERGDSVVGPKPEVGTDMSDMFRRPDVERLVELKAQYLETHGWQKVGLREAIVGLQGDIAGGQTGVTKGVTGFYWSVEFAEVFFAGGFHVVLANPPYIRQELIKEQKPDLKEFYGDLFCGTADLYVFFYIRAIQMLKPGGMIAFISSNKWFRAKYGENLRRYVAEQTCVNSITDFGELPVFNSATFPMIFIAQKGASDCRTLFTQVKSLDPPYPDVLAIVREEGKALPADAITGANWMLTDAASADRVRKMEKAGMPLGEYVKGVMFRGPVTGLNVAFYITRAERDELVALDPRNGEIIKPVAVGDDIRKWRIEGRDRWIIFPRRGIAIDEYPAIKRHLAQFRERLEPKPRDWPEGEKWPGRAAGDYKWYELQASPGDVERFENPKIVYPDIAKESRFAYDTSGLYINDLAFVIPSSDLFLLGVLNSSPVWDYLCGKAAVLGDVANRGRIRLKRIYMSKVPIPTASDADKAAIAALVQKCLDAEGVGCEEWEREIDERVAALYGL